MRMLRLAVAVAAMVLCGRTVSAQADVKIIVNAQNPVTSIAKPDLARMFLKQLTSWKDGKPVQPVDLGPEESARIAFSKATLGKDVNSVRSFWQQQVFSGRDTAPPEKGSVAELVAYVVANVGAIGYVPASTPLGSGLKVVTVVR